MNIPGASAAVSGLRAHSTSFAVSAHNTANVNTGGFRDQQVSLQERPVSGVDANVGSPLQASASSSASVDNAAAPQIRPEIDLRDAGSGADLAAAAVTQISASNAFKAQAGVIKNGSALTGTLVDLAG
jgi:flagellar hook protein FlgE